LVLLVFFGLSVLYAFLLRERVVVLLLAAYAAGLVADKWGDTIYQMISGQAGNILNQGLVVHSISVFSVQVALFALVLLVISLRGGLLVNPSTMGRGIWSLLIILGYGFLTAALIATSILNFLSPDIREAIIGGSALAKYLINYQAWWLILPLALMIVSGGRTSEE